MMLGYVQQQGYAQQGYADASYGAGGGGQQWGGAQSGAGGGQRAGKAPVSRASDCCLREVLRLLPGAILMPWCPVDMQFVPGKVFLGGVSNDSTFESLSAYAGQWGPLADAHIMAGKGYAFITFADVSAAQAFLEVSVGLSAARVGPTQPILSQPADWTAAWRLLLSALPCLPIHAAPRALH